MTIQITTDELRSFCRDNYGKCSVCRGLLIRMANDDSDLRRAAKNMARWPNSKKCLANIKAVKTKQQELQERARNHVEYDHE